METLSEDAEGEQVPEEESLPVEDVTGARWAGASAPEAPEDSEMDEEPLTASLSGVKFPRRRIGERMTSVVGARQVSLPTALLQPTGTGGPPIRSHRPEGVREDGSVHVEGPSTFPVETTPRPVSHTRRLHSPTAVSLSMSPSSSSHIIHEDASPIHPVSPTVLDGGSKRARAKRRPQPKGMSQGKEANF